MTDSSAPVTGVAGSTPSGPATSPRPGYCAAHPGQRLVTHHAAGLRWPYLEDPHVVCVMCLDAAASPLEAERCRQCGALLYPAGTRWSDVNPLRATCSGRCRVRAYRAGWTLDDAGLRLRPKKGAHL